MNSPLQSRFVDLPLNCLQDRRAASKHVQYAHGDSSAWKWSFFSRTDSAGPRIGIPTTNGGNVRSVKLARLEAVLFIAEGALSMRRLAQLATLADAAEARALIDQLNHWYDDDGCAFRIERVATGCQLMSRPQFAYWLDKLHHRQSSLKLSSPAMETLSIVAYRQPMTRADVESIRGVQSSEMLKYLMERGLVRVAGYDDSLGRPYLYETTRRFLELFGLRNLDDLPLAEQLRQVKPEGKADTEQANLDAATAPDDSASVVSADGDSMDDPAGATAESQTNDAADDIPIADTGNPLPLETGSPDADENSFHSNDAGQAA